MTPPPWKRSYDKLRQCTKKQRHYFVNKGPSSQSYGFSSSHVWMWVLDHKEGWAPKNWWFLNCGVGEDSWESIGWQRDQTSQFFLNLLWKDCCWNWSSSTLATWCEELTHLKRPWCWERLKAGGEGDDRGWDGWMASPTQRTWVWASSRRWWRTGKPGVLQSMGSQRVKHNWATEQDKTMAESKEELKSLLKKVKEESEKAGLNSTFRKLRSWQMNS